MDIMMSKEATINQLYEEIKICKKCSLWRYRKNPVPGEGNINAVIMFIGEAPGYNEDLQGRPFVGAAGSLLDELLSSIGLSREDVYICNVLKCRPPNNRDPEPSEVLACTSFLDKQLELIKPRIIVTLGRHSTSYILSKASFRFDSITKTHGKVYDATIFDYKVSVVPTFHPAAALYNMQYKKELENDFKILHEILSRIRG